MQAFTRKTIKIAALVAVLVVALALTACRGDNDNGGGAATPTPTPVATPSPTPANGGAEVVEPDPEPIPAAFGLHAPVDLGGREIRIGTWWENTLSQAMLGDEPDMETAVDYFIERQIWDNARRVERDFNVTFREIIIPYDDFFAHLTTTAMAGEPFAEILMLEGYMILAASQNNIIQPINSILLPGSDVQGSRTFTTARVESGGNIWSMHSNAPIAGGIGLGVNLDIINAIGANNPVTLYEQGQWTWDAFLDIMRLATRDTTGDNIVDQFGIAGTPADIIAHLIASNDGVLVNLDLNYGFDHPNTIEALELVQTIFSERLWYYDRIGELEFDAGNWGRNFFAFQDGVATFWPLRTWAVQDVPPTFSWAFVPFPRGPENRSGNTMSAGWPQSFAIAAGIDRPEEILTVFEELMAWPGEDTTLLFEAGAGWPRQHFPTEADVVRMMRVFDNTFTDIGWNVYQYDWVIGDIATDLWSGERTVAEAIEYHRGPSQERLDLAFRQ